MRLRVIAVMCCALLVAAGCGGDDDDESAPTTTSGNAGSTTTTPGPSTTAPSSTPTVTEVFPTDELPCQEVPAPTTPVTGPAPAGEVLLTNVEELGDDCVDHVVFSLKSKNASAPGYEVTYGTPPFHEDGSGKTVAVAGTSVVVVKIRPGYGYDFEAGTPTYTGSKRITPSSANHVREIVQLGDFEGTLTWAIGLDSKRPFTVQATTSPQVQLAVTVG